MYLHPRKPRHNPFRYTAFMQCNRMGYAWAYKDDVLDAQKNYLDEFGLEIRFFLIMNSYLEA